MQWDLSCPAERDRLSEYSHAGNSGNSVNSLVLIQESSNTGNHRARFPPHAPTLPPWLLGCRPTGRTLPRAMLPWTKISTDPIRSSHTHRNSPTRCQIKKKPKLLLSLWTQKLSLKLLSIFSKIKLFCKCKTFSCIFFPIALGILFH